MKKFFSILFILISITSCFKNENNKTVKQKTPSTNKQLSIDKNTVFSFDINTLKSGCDNQSQIICSINNNIKCTINPHFEDCKNNKAFMPNFIFMQDDNLKRPTSQSYKITKIKPLADGNIEVYTQSTCNGNWFGLCNGNIIYVMYNQNNQWIIKEIYAIED